MTRRLAACAAALALVTLPARSEEKLSPLYALKMDSLAGKPVEFRQYRGKVLLIVNVASECGYTPQYKGLQDLDTKYAAKGLVVLGVPSNDFGQQEPGTNAQIAAFCKKNYGVTFPMFSKITVTRNLFRIPVR